MPSDLKRSLIRWSLFSFLFVIAVFDGPEEGKTRASGHPVIGVTSPKELKNKFMNLYRTGLNASQRISIALKLRNLSDKYMLDMENPIIVGGRKFYTSNKKRVAISRTPTSLPKVKLVDNRSPDRAPPFLVRDDDASLTLLSGKIILNNTEIKREKIKNSLAKYFKIRKIDHNKTAGHISLTLSRPGRVVEFYRQMTEDPELKRWRPTLEVVSYSGEI